MGGENPIGAQGHVSASKNDLTPQSPRRSGRSVKVFYISHCGARPLPHHTINYQCDGEFGMILAYSVIKAEPMPLGRIDEADMVVARATGGDEMSRQSFMRVAAFAILLAVALVQPFGAVAGTITFFDLTETATVSLSSDIIARGSTGSCTGEVCTVTLYPPTTPSGSVSYANTTILEPGSSAVSDVIAVVPTFTTDGTFNTQFFTITFTSDTDGGPALPDLGNDITEDGTIQEANGINWPAVDDVIQFQSDAIETVPEPTSLAVFGAALAAIGLIRRRRV